jgi:hypothetical protein
LVLFCLSADLLCEQLRRLSNYACENTMVVNVGKCKIVVFGNSTQLQVFKYRRKIIPIRRSCKYLGVWLNGELGGRALTDAVTQKFTAAVLVFFHLCRRLRLARLDLVFRLANAMVFSLLNGCEFLRRTNVIAKCEAAWRKGVCGLLY